MNYQKLDLRVDMSFLVTGRAGQDEALCPSCGAELTLMRILTALIEPSQSTVHVAGC